MGGARRTSWRRRPPSATAIRCRPSRSCRRSCSRRPGRARCRWWPLPAGSAMHRGWGRQILPAPPALRAARWRRAGGATGAGLIGSRTCYLLSTSCSAAWRSSGCAGCAGRLAIDIIARARAPASLARGSRGTRLYVGPLRGSIADSRTGQPRSARRTSAAAKGPLEHSLTTHGQPLLLSAWCASPAPASG